MTAHEYCLGHDGNVPAGGSTDLRVIECERCIAGEGRRLEHHVSCGTTSGPRGTADFERVEKLARKLRVYAESLGFAVMYENCDEDLS